MKIVLVFVSTLDGKVTKWGDPFVRKWSSNEDQVYFSKIWKNSKLIVVGSNTFNADILKPSVNNRILVMTSQPGKYKEFEVKDHLEFTDESPVQLTSHFSKEGYEQMLLAGGSHIASSFLREQLVDELWLTLEPKIFGTGNSFVLEEEFDIKLRLISCEKVNEQGTLITKYAVLKS